MITITNNNIYFNEFPLSTLSSLDDVEIVDIQDIINFLSENVELGESVTFKRLFSLVSFNVEKFNDIFYSALGGHSLEPYLQEIENNSTEKIESEYLEIYWFCEKYEDELSLYPSLQGISETERYALDFVSLNNIKDFNLRLNEKVEIIDYNKLDNDDLVKLSSSKTDSDLINRIDEIMVDSETEKDMKLSLGNKAFTLFEIFNAIFQEISFHGGPLDKKQKFQELESSIEEIEKNIEESKSENKLVTFEEILEKFDSEDKYLVKYKELRDRIEEDRVTDKRKLNKLKSCLLEKLKIFDTIENSDENLNQYHKKLTDIEYNMQILYGEQEDASFHRFWETPKCTCPKIDNLELYPSKTPIFNDKCPIHGLK